MDILFTPFIVFSILPPIPFLLVYFIHFFMKGDKKAALMLAMDVSTLFLILATAALFNNVFNNGFGFYLILLVVLITCGLIGGAQNRMKGKVDVQRLIRAVWRLTFAGTGVAYIILFVISLITYISTI